MITAETLTHVPLFARLPENERGSLAARAADVRLQQDEWLLIEGQTAAFFAVLEGTLSVVKSIGGRDHQLTRFVPGDYFGEVPLLLGSPTVASVRAVEPARVMRLDSSDFHDLISHCRVLNGEIMKTMALRVNKIQQVVADTTAVVATVIGRRDDDACFQAREFLSRNRVGFAWRDLDEPDTFARLAYDGIIASVADGPAAFADTRLPLVILADGRRIEAPSLRELAHAVGLQTEPHRDAYDVVIVGGGPAGLAAAVYGASEGLGTLLVERVACGGQAGTSARIENYLGFPAGLSGDDLSGKARQQALRFNAELLVARSVDSIELGDPHSSDAALHTIVLDDGTRLTTKAVVMATGVQWRRLDTPGIERLTGHGVYYGAAADGSARRPRLPRPPHRRRQFGRSGRDAVRELRRVGDDARAREDARGEHVAVSDRPARDEGERDDRDGGRGRRGRGHRSDRRARGRDGADAPPRAARSRMHCSSSLAHTPRRRGFRRN